MRFFLYALLAATSVTAQPKETFSYRVEWRLITAGRTTLQWEAGRGGYNGNLTLQSTGLVSRLFRVNDTFDTQSGASLCAQQTHLRAEEGSRRRETLVRWTGGTSNYVEKDLKKNGEVILERTLDVPPCVHDILGSLAKLRSLTALAVGQSTTIPISDGKKFAQARVEAQEKEKIATKAGTFNTIRYEAFLFNGVLFQRSARLLIWISDDARRLPVQIQVRMRIHIGNVTFELDKVEPPL
ncbi:MAG: DUF3108 domain-containing protein [Acidobacteria bacterium]|nr:DUF3108 domain-containing protein [Acidobacteriota bacterium]